MISPLRPTVPFTLVKAALSDTDFQFLLTQLQSRKQGQEVCLHLLDGYLERGRKEIIPPTSLVELMRSIVLDFDFKFSHNHRNSDRHRYMELETVITHCFKGNTAKRASHALLVKIRSQLPGRWSVPDNLKGVLQQLIKLQPTVFLNVFLEAPAKFKEDLTKNDHLHMFVHRSVSNMPIDVLKAWVLAQPEEDRTVTLATSLNVWSPDDLRSDEGEVNVERWVELIRFLFNTSAHQKQVLTALKDFYRTSYWVGNRATFLRKTIPVYEELSSSEDKALQLWATEQSEELAAEISAVEKSDQAFNSPSDTGEPSFES